MLAATAMIPEQMAGAEPSLEEGLAEVCSAVNAREGVDLRAYRPSTVRRRVTGRLQKLGYSSYDEYVLRLAADPDEARRLVEHVTIKVSRFFRDARVFARLRAEVLPDLVRRNWTRGQLRIWSAGCGNGEEPYSLAILIEEMARGGAPVPEVSIYATDVDEAALAAARGGIYPRDVLSETPPDLVATYFTQRDGRFAPQYELSPQVRPRVKLLRHDLLSEVTAPDGLSFDLVLCRNVLIYFERPAQERALSVLAAGTALDGYLCLGEAEQLANKHRSEFEVIDRQARLYRKIQPPPKERANHSEWE